MERKLKQKANSHQPSAQTTLALAPFELMADG
jgi:hypothetical protein